MNPIFDPSLALYLPLYELDGSSFMSGDGYGRLCAPAGASWSPYGRYFDGVDDLISCGSMTLDVVTYMAWVKNTEVAVAVNRIFDFADGVNYKNISTNGSGVLTAYSTGGFQYTATTDIRGTTWKHIAVTMQTDNVHFYINGVVDPVTAGSNFTVNSYSATLGIGRQVVAATTPFNGSIGDAWIYRRALAPQEIQQNYLTTKWRYR